MSAMERCEPPEKLRGVDGWHWVQFPAAGPQIWLWDASGNRWITASGPWLARWAAQDGVHYLAPVATPAEVETLRFKLDRAENNERGVLQALDEAQAEVEALRRERDEARAEVDALRAEAAEWCQKVQLFEDVAQRRKDERDAIAIAFTKLSAVLRVNMLRHGPLASHAEIDAAIDACLGPVARAALEAPR